MPDDDSKRDGDGGQAGGMAFGTGLADMHAQILQQVSDLLKDSDLSEEEKQTILASISCPCCGGAGPSLVIDLGPSRSKGPAF